MKVFVFNRIPFCISMGGGRGGGTGPLGGEDDIFLQVISIWLAGRGKPPYSGMGSHVS